MTTQPATIGREARGALTGLRVLDLSESIAGQFGARMLADHGARVTLIEPPGGSVIRAMPPFDRDPKGVGSQLFFHLNLGKDSWVLDRSAPADRARLLEAVRGADVVVVATQADSDAFERANPACVIARASDFGEDGPLRHWRGSEMIFQALSGMMNENGLPGREPLYGVGHRAQYAAGVGVFIMVLAALHAREGNGRGQAVALDVAQNTIAMAPPAVVEYAYSGLQEARGEARRPFMVVRCRDGWVSIWVHPYVWSAFCRVADIAELEHDPRFAAVKERQDHWAELTAQVQARVRDWRGDDFLDRLLAERIAGAKAYTANQLWSGTPHLAVRDYWRAVPTALGPRPILGPQFRLGVTPGGTARGAPRLGETAGEREMEPVTDRVGRGVAASAAKTHEAAVDRSAGAGPRGDTDTSRPAAAAPGPLAGIRVLDLSTAWAGPMAGRILSFLGAEVIKVESASNPDIWRMATAPIQPRRYPGAEPGERPYNRCALFNSQNHDKLSLCVDIKHPKGLAAVHRLAATVDAVICNFTAGTLSRMGLGYEALRRIKDDIIVVEMPGFGNSGPLAKAAANGTTMEMGAGMCAMIGYPGGAPTTTGQFYPDPMGGYHGAAAVLLALRHRQASGEGQAIEISQVEASMQFIGEELLHAIATGVDPQPQGNRVRWAAPHDVYRTFGDDQWVAIAVQTDSEWRRFCELIGQPSLADDARFASFDARWRHQDLLREPITGWTRGQAKADVAERLQRAGIRAAPVNRPDDLLGHPYLMARGGFVEMTHPQAGTHAYLSLPFRLNGTPGAQRRASPCLGADSHRILREMARLSADEVAELETLGVLSTIPIG